MDQFGMERKTATITECAITLFFAVIVCLGYNRLYFEVTLPNGAVGQILDIMDYISNNLLMPIVSIGTCILVGWVLKPDIIIDEVTKNGEPFRRRGIFLIMLRCVAPLLLLILLLIALGIL